MTTIHPGGPQNEPDSPASFRWGGGVSVRSVQPVVMNGTRMHEISLQTSSAEMTLTAEDLRPFSVSGSDSGAIRIEVCKTLGGTSADASWVPTNGVKAAVQVLQGVVILDEGIAELEVVVNDGATVSVGGNAGMNLQAVVADRAHLHVHGDLSTFGAYGRPGSRMMNDGDVGHLVTNLDPNSVLRIVGNVEKLTTKRIRGSLDIGLHVTYAQDLNEVRHGGWLRMGSVGRIGRITNCDPDAIAAVGDPFREVEAITL